ncbi:MAG TPA: potassium channel family protein [Terriglobales bacterium]|nr:potassium channel family protein [Terriglobales bacterium]
MRAIAAISGFLIIAAVLLDSFETVVLPRRIQRSFRITSWFYRHTWVPWSRLGRQFKSINRREAFLSYFGPLSLIVLLVFWAGGLIFGFALLQYGGGQHISLNNQPVTFGGLMYHSGETFFTLGYGDILPISRLARTLAVMEAGTGFGFLAIVIGYLPVVYSSFSAREHEISLLDSRAGSPPTAVELLKRLGCCPDQSTLDQIFRDWEGWAAQILESHLSYPVLSFFRSQHSNQSWLGALTLMLDVTALVIAGVDGIRPEQAKLTFAMARHAAVDLAQVVNARYNPHADNRLPEADFQHLEHILAASGLRVHTDPEAVDTLEHLRAQYEPYIEGIGRNLLIDIPKWFRDTEKKDNWQAGPWDRAIQARSLESISTPRAREHF